jgi:ArsR family transcriptional regulator, arsenate/arsenite/antimonite-responsive transcriptional repressor
MRNVIDELKAMSDPNRLRILSLLWDAENLCGCEVEKILDLRQSNTSRQLNRLLTAGLIHSYKKAQWAHYQIASPHDREDSLLRKVIEEARDEGSVSTGEVLQTDIEKLHDYRRRGYTCQTIDEWIPFEGLVVTPDEESHQKL